MDTDFSFSPVEATASSARAQYGVLQAQLDTNVGGRRRTAPCLRLERSTVLVDMIMLAGLAGLLALQTTGTKFACVAAER